MFRRLIRLLSKWPKPKYRERRYVKVSRYKRVTAEPPPTHWAPCHPSTIRRFKASMTCPNGYGLILREHSIATSGEVSPSVVCPTPGCPSTSSSGSTAGLSEHCHRGPIHVGGLASRTRRRPPGRPTARRRDFISSSTWWNSGSSS